MLNYRVDPRLLIPLSPSGVELDFFQSETYVSIVGLFFLDTQLRGGKSSFLRAPKIG